MKHRRFLLLLPEYRVDEGMGGIGVRALDLALALASTGEVTIVCAQESDLADQSCDIIPLSRADIPRLIERADAVFFFDLGDLKLLRLAVAMRRFVVVENAVPLEHLEYNPELQAPQRAEAYRGYVTGFRGQLLAADHFLARSEIERRMLIAALAVAGRLSPDDVAHSRTLDHLVTLVPIGFSRRESTTLAGLSPDPSLVLWTGGLWDYMAYEAALAAFVDDGPESLAESRLSFLYRPPADQKLTAHDVFGKVTTGGRISFAHEPVPHSARGDIIEQANALICLAKTGIENEACVRLRVRDSLLYRRPLITDPFGATGEYVERTGIGVTVRDLSVEAIASAVDGLRCGSAQRAACLEAIEEERSNCILENALDRLLLRGELFNWNPTRPAYEIIQNLDRLLEGESHAAVVPFLT